MTSFLKKILENEFAKNVITLVSGTTVAQMIPVLISPILTRIYSPSDFAVLGMFTSITLILSEIVSGKFEMAVMNTDDEIEQKKITTLTVTTIIFFSVIFLILFALFFDKIPFLQVEGLKKWKYLLVVSIALIGFSKLLTFLSTKKKKYKTIAYGKVVRSISLSIFQLGLYFLKYFGLIVGYLMATIAEISVLLIKNTNMYKKLNTKQLVATLKRHKKFPLFDVPSSLLNIGSIQAPILMLPSYFGSVYGGLYFQAFKVLTMPVSLIGGAVGQVFFEQGSSLKNEPEKFSKLVLDLHKKLVFSIIPFAIIAFFGQELFGFVFGQEWELSGKYAMIMTPWLFFNFLTSPIASIIIIKERQGLGFIFIFFMSLFRLLGLGLGVFYFKDIDITIVLFSVTSAISYFVYSSFLIHKFLTIGLKNYWLIILKLVIPTIIGFAIIKFLLFEKIF
ncbi:oligosaccharide flippase family protein [uncultured Algibacter sp.]|uniref:lipopolysaccharide biosynthesis protein n=1 Tax=uncultured Algibacter sp. TaxID=298659 RepID=UPI0026123262|nr:oligosaccharide flippase family protein [uncultured Algibacter sp.]